MSSIAGITQEQLLANKKVRHIDFDGEWYFSIYDLNQQYIGAFKNTIGWPLPFKKQSPPDSSEMISCISFSEVAEVAKSLEGRPEFNQAIDVLFGFNKRPKG